MSDDAATAAAEAAAQAEAEAKAKAEAEGKNEGPELTVEEQLAAAQADAEKWKKNSRKNEDRAKANTQAAKDLEALRLSSMSEQEQAVALATAAGRSEAMAEMAAEIIETKLGAAGVPTAISEHLNFAKFLDDEGKPNDEAIAAFAETAKPPAVEEGDGKPAFGGGFGQDGGRTGSYALNDNDALGNALGKALGLEM